MPLVLLMGLLSLGVGLVLVADRPAPHALARRETAAYHPPLPGRVPVTSGYGWRLFGSRTQLHEGIDLGAPAGTPVLAVEAGVVEQVDVACAMQGCGPGFWNGNAVHLKTGEGLSWKYLHLSGVAVRAGARVQRGEVLGWVGNTGQSRGAHLHLQVHARDGRSFDPRPLFAPGTFA